MQRDLTSLAFRALAFIVPATGLAVAGTAWLIEHDLWILFGMAVAALSGACLLAARFYARPRVRSTPTAPPVDTWPEAGNAAWGEIDHIATRVATSPPAIGDMGAYRDLALNVLESVGRHFHPTSASPRLELTLAQTLALAERVLRDVQAELLDAIPGGRSVTLAHLDLARRAGAYVPAARDATRAAFLANRVRRWVVAWPVALAYEVVNLFDVSPGAVARRQVDRIAADLFVRRTGTYAIEAFSDRVALDLKQVESIAAAKPLRIMLLGPINAGKSSLLNAIFGQERSRRDILPRLDSCQEHVLDRDGAPRAIILESNGFGGVGDADARRAVVGAMPSIDLIIVVTSARQAARQLECQTLDEVRRLFGGSPRRTCPPVLVAATHIDLLRPAQEWNPPYDFLDGVSAKEQSVRQAVDAIATDFQVSLDRVIPVSLLERSEYNVEEGLLPAIGLALPEADRAKLLRIIDETRSAESRDRVGKGIAFLLAAGRHVVASMTPK